jgi:hypothetical protein
MNPQLPIKLDLTLEEVDGIMLALGELPTKSNAFMLMAKIRGQAQVQLPEAPVEVEDVKPEDIKTA